MPPAARQRAPSCVVYLVQSLPCGSRETAHFVLPTFAGGEDVARTRLYAAV